MVYAQITCLIHVKITFGRQNNESCPDHISKIMRVHAQHRPYTKHDKYYYYKRQKNLN
jgi:hypothetical protein